MTDPSDQNGMTPKSSTQQPVSDSHVDLAVLLQNLDKFYLLIEPAQSLYKAASEAHGWAWRRPSVLLGLNMVCAICSSGSIITVLLLITIGIAAVGMSHRQTGVLKKVLPWAQESTVSSERSRQEMLQYYKSQLYNVNVAVSLFNSKLEKFYSILKWDSLKFSAKCYSIVIGSLLCLSFLPANCNLLLIMNASLLLNTSQGVRGSIREIKDTLKSKSLIKGEQAGFQSKDRRESDKIKSQASRHRTKSVSQSGSEVMFHEAAAYSSSEEDSAAAHSQAKVTEKFSSSSDESDFEFDVSQAEIPINDANEGSKPIENIGKSVDAPPSRKLKITANRHQVSAPQLQIQQQSTLGQIMTGFCKRCGAEFSTLSKKRHYCSHCGNHFCFRCCSYRAPKSVFGATAPGSDIETVPVCCECYSELTNGRDT